MSHILPPVTSRYRGSEERGLLRSTDTIPGLELILRLTQVAQDGTEQLVVGTVAHDHNKEIFTPEGWAWPNGTPIQFAQNIGLTDEYALLKRGVFSNRPKEYYPGLHAEPVVAFDEIESQPGYAVHRLITPDGIFDAIKAGRMHRLRIAYIARELAPFVLPEEVATPEVRPALRLIA